MLFVDFSSEVLPTQNVWKKILAASLPTIIVSKEAKRKGHQFELNKQIYWSSFETTKAWIAEIILIY